jgi:hypothetical protein
MLLLTLQTYFVCSQPQQVLQDMILFLGQKTVQELECMELTTLLLTMAFALMFLLPSSVFVTQ